jgi:hypothetical protein
MFTHDTKTDASANANTQIQTANYDRSHGSAFDRGSADAFYGRPKNPHKYPKGSYISPRIQLLDPIEISQYNEGYDGQNYRKDWGGGNEEYNPEEHQY